jgi:hypothetical protein
MAGVLLVIFLLQWFVEVTTSWSIPLISRPDFVALLIKGASVPPILFSTSGQRLLVGGSCCCSVEANDENDDVLVLPMKSLPVSGCWIVSIILSLDPESPESYIYPAVVDSGSPFLTAPLPAMNWTTAININKNHTLRRKECSFITDTSSEQYGTTVGSVEWRRAPLVTLVGVNGTIRDQLNVVVGLPSLQVQQETGGIFLGLMQQDTYRPTFMQQFGFKSFQMIFSASQPLLVLSKSSLINAHVHHDDPVLPLYDLSPYGPDINHYGIMCRKVVCRLESSLEGSRIHKTVTFQSQSFSRPLVAVLDTGLSGCIFSDTLWEEMQQQNQYIDGSDVPAQLNPTGCQVELVCDDDNNTTLTLSSDTTYWRFQSFRLPWWYDQQSIDTDAPNDSVQDDHRLYPHVIVLGSTFWNHVNVESLCVDTIQKMARIGTKHCN